MITAITLREEILRVGLSCYLNEVPCSAVSSCYQHLHFGFLQLTWSCWIIGLPILAGPSMKNPLNCTIGFLFEEGLGIMIYKRYTFIFLFRVARWKLVAHKPCQPLKQLFDKNVAGSRLCPLHVYKWIDNCLYNWPFWLISNGLHNNHKHAITKFIADQIC